MAPRALVTWASLAGKVGTQQTLAVRELPPLPVWPPGRGRQETQEREQQPPRGGGAWGAHKMLEYPNGKKKGEKQGKKCVVFCSCVVKHIKHPAIWVPCCQWDVMSQEVCQCAVLGTVH